MSSNVFDYDESNVSISDYADLDNGVKTIIVTAVSEQELNILQGGSTGQVLSKKSNTDFDFEWLDNVNAISVHRINTANTHIANAVIGQQYLMITRNGTQIETVLLNDESKLDKAGGTIDGSLIVKGDLHVNGTEYIETIKSLAIKDKMIITNADKSTLGSHDFSGLGININTQDTYGIVYDTDSQSVKLGLGKIAGYVLTTEQPADWAINWKTYYVNIGTAQQPIWEHVSGNTAPTWEPDTYYKYDTSFLFNLDEGAAIATRADSSDITNNHLVAFSKDANDKVILVDSGDTAAAIREYIQTESAKKVDKTNSANKVYGTDENGDQTIYDKDSFGQKLNLDNGIGLLSIRQLQADVATFESLLYTDNGVQYPYFDIALLNAYLSEDVENNEAFEVVNNQFTVDGIEYTINADATQVSGNGHTYNIAQRSFKIPIPSIKPNGTVQCWLKYSNDGTTITYVSLGQVPGAYGNYTAMFNGRSLALAEYASAFGQSSIAYGIRSFVANTKNSAYGQNGFATGALNSSWGKESASFNYHNLAKADYTFAAGYENLILGLGAAGFGRGNTAKGPYSAVFGYNNKTGINAEKSFTTGQNNESNGIASFTSGGNNVANGNNSDAHGYSTESNGAASTTYGSNTKTLKLIESNYSGSTPSAPTLKPGVRYRFSGELPTTGSWSISCSSIESINQISGEDIQVPTEKFEFGPGYLQVGYISVIDFVGSFNFYFESLTGDISPIIDKIKEEPVITLTKGKWYHFNGTVPNVATEIKFSKIYNVQTESTKTTSTAAWSFMSGHLSIGPDYYASFTGSFDFMFDGDTDIDITGSYAYLYSVITTSMLSTVGGNEFAMGAGTEAFGHGAFANGVLTNAYGESAFAAGYNTQSGLLGTWVGFVKDRYDGTESSKSQISVPTTKHTFTAGIGTFATDDGQAVFGRYNSAMPDYLLIVGCGINDANRDDALAVSSDGHLYLWKAPSLSGHAVRKKELDELNTSIQNSLTALTNLINTKASSANPSFTGNVGISGNLLFDGTRGDCKLRLGSGATSIDAGNSMVVGYNAHVASGSTCSIAVGLSVYANAKNTAVFNSNNIAGYENQTVVGKFNSNNANTLFEVGNGVNNSSRSNAFEVLDDGRAKVKTAPVDTDDVVRKGDVASLAPPANIDSISMANTALTPDGNKNVDIPVATSSTFGVARYLSDFGISIYNGGNNNGYVAISPASNANITSRNANKAIIPNNLDFAVKAALTDGIGAAYTAAEQTAAKVRLGIVDAVIEDYTVGGNS